MQNYPEFQDRSFVTELLKKCIELTDPHYAVVMPYKFIAKSEIQGKDLWIGWQTYLANKKAAESLPENVAWDKFNSGILFTASDKIVYSDSTEAIANMIRIHDMLAPEGFLDQAKQILLARSCRRVLSTINSERSGIFDQNRRLGKRSGLRKRSCF